MNKYTITQFRTDFPNDDVCLAYIFAKKFPTLKGYYRIKSRKAFANAQGKQIYPLKSTIFEKSNTKLTLWFYAIYLFSVSKNGVSAKELQRQLGVTYKTAWRIAKQIRSLMEDGGDMLGGIVEVDETYIGGYRKGGQGGKGKTPVFGMVERGGALKARVIEARETHILLNEIKENVEKGTMIMSDQLGAYRKTNKLGFTHDAVNHWKKEFARGRVHTNSIEGFWSQMKRSIRGTYHFVSVKHLQAYANEFAFRYSHRQSPIFSVLMARI